MVDKHTDSEVLLNCARVLENLCSEDYPIAGKCNIAKSTLVDELVQKYKQAFKDFFSGVSQACCLCTSDGRTNQTHLFNLFEFRMREYNCTHTCTP